MTVQLWRIAVEAKAYSADDMSGAGAKITGGRWNSPGTAMVYASVNVALAVLETLSHVRSAGLPYNRFLVRIDVPPSVWALRETLAHLPGGWDAVPSGLASCKAGDAWIAARRSPLLVVPSVIVPQEHNVLINPAHPETKKIGAVTVERWHYDPRFF